MRLFLVLFTAAAFAQQEQQRQDPPLRIPEGVRVERDVVYARYGARELKADLYLPGVGAGPRPAVVYIHGGGWKNGNRNAFSRQAAHMAGLGYVGMCIEYRLSGEATWPAAIHDSKAAVRYLRAHAEKLKINANKIGAAGGSAGGHLAALLGTTAHLKALEGDGGHARFSSAVQAVAAFNPAVDLVDFGKRANPNATNSVTEFLGAGYQADRALWELATPITHVSAKSAPTLFLHGDADPTVPYAQSERMAAKLKAAGVRAEIFTAPEAKHGFFNRPPWFEPTLKKMEEFFLAVLGK